MPVNKVKKKLSPSSKQIATKERTTSTNPAQTTQLSVSDKSDNEVSSKDTNSKKRKKFTFKRKKTNNTNISQYSENTYKTNTSQNTEQNPEQIEIERLKQEDHEMIKDIKAKIRDMENDIRKEQNHLASTLEKQVLAVGKDKNSKHYQLIEQVINHMQSMPHFLKYHLNEEHIENLIVDCQRLINTIESDNNPFKSTHLISRTTDTDKKLIPALKKFLQKSKLCLQQKLYTQQLENAMTMIENERMMVVVPSDIEKYKKFLDYFTNKYSAINNHVSALSLLINRYKYATSSHEEDQEPLSKSIVEKQNKLLQFIAKQTACCDNVNRLSRLNGGSLVDIFNIRNEIDVRNKYTNNNIVDSMRNLYNRDTYSVSSANISEALGASRYSGYDRI